MHSVSQISATYYSIKTSFIKVFSFNYIAQRYESFVAQS